MPILRAFLSGWRRLRVSWWLLPCLWLVNFAVALPFAWVLSESIRDSIGTSLIHESLQEGFDMGWYGEFSEGAEGLGSTFTPTLAGAGAFYANLEAWLTGGLFRLLPALVLLGVGYALFWTLLLGGVVQRLVMPQRRFSLAELLSGCGRYFARFLRLVAIAAVPYFLIFRLQRWLFARVEEWTRDVTVERTVLLYVLLASSVVALLLIVVHVAFDYAKIATVVESRRSMLLAALRGFGFVLSAPVRTLGLYLLVALTAGVLLLLYAQVAAQGGPATLPGILLAFLLGQAFLFARLGLRLVLLGGQIALYQEATGRAGGTGRVE